MPSSPRTPGRINRPGRPAGRQVHGLGWLSIEDGHAQAVTNDVITPAVAKAKTKLSLAITAKLKGVCLAQTGSAPPCPPGSPTPGKAIRSRFSATSPWPSWPWPARTALIDPAHPVQAQLFRSLDVRRSITHQREDWDKNARAIRSAVCEALAHRGTSDDPTRGFAASLPIGMIIDPFLRESTTRSLVLQLFPSRSELDRKNGKAIFLIAG